MRRPSQSIPGSFDGNIPPRPAGYRNVVSIAMIPNRIRFQAPASAKSRFMIGVPAWAMKPATMAPAGVVMPPTTAKASSAIEAPGRKESPVIVMLEVAAMRPGETGETSRDGEDGHLPRAHRQPGDARDRVPGAERLQRPTPGAAKQRADDDDADREHGHREDEEAPVVAEIDPEELGSIDGEAVRS